MSFGRACFAGVPAECHGALLGSAGLRECAASSVTVGNLQRRGPQGTAWWGCGRAWVHETLSADHWAQRLACS